LTMMSDGSAMLPHTIGKIETGVEKREVRKDLQEYRLPAWC